MGRGKIEIKKIENTTSRQVTFTKRRKGLIKKASELAILTDATVGLLILSSTQKTYEYCSLGSERMLQLIQMYYEKKNNTTKYEDSKQLLTPSQQMYHEVMRMRFENDSLQKNMRLLTGEDLTDLSINDLKQLEQQLENSAKKIRHRKDQLMEQQITNLSRNVHMNQDQNNYYCTAQMMMEQQQLAVEDHKVIREMGLFGDHQNYGHCLMMDEEARNLLQLGPQMHQYQLQPTQPNLQELGLHGHGLQL